MDGKMDFNELGIAFICPEISKEIADKVSDKMYEISTHFKNLAQKELDAYLDTLNLESIMGVIVEKIK